ncbi:MAG: hypothetical protein B7Z60_00005 [Ferrovum sp. 37-45-19]|nr:MAG: hypothetical protein B7Z65_03295 [Ferrovum sp. 21-44-67]OYV95580.1 MAG: hypothetical protein B7Z60_00005 [Ferrovum sp. 37-45-19]OZB31619.1 MAG: hypothetical protein B7X47_09190 [Ferrovum sp. 34-44-207]
MAEGVETEEQHHLLKSFDCDYAQGFLYSKAVTSTEFELLIQKANFNSLGMSSSHDWPTMT